MLSIEEGWQNWENTSGRSSYKVVSKENLEVPFFSKKIPCFKIKSKARFDFGTSFLTFYFSKKYGFVEEEYEFYTGEKLDIILNDIR